MFKKVTVKAIGNYTFRNSSITSVIIPEGVEVK
ncbi:MAG: leucine-rich repeat domain-containing protein [Clostridiales bacterium]|nr:leucine-rich repeat domain-containing protein [Clostridiales bacterium]